MHYYARLRRAHKSAGLFRKEFTGKVIEHGAMGRRKRRQTCAVAHRQPNWNQGRRAPVAA